MKSILKSRIFAHRKITWLLLFSFFSLALVGWLIYRSENNIEQMNQRINQSYEIIIRAQQIGAQTAESGQDVHLWLESGDKQAALRLKASAAGMQQEISLLQQLSTANDDQVEPINLLYQTILSRNVLEDSLLRTSTPAGLAQHIINLNNNINALLQSVRMKEESLLSGRKLSNRLANRKTAIALVTGRVASFLFVVILLIQLNKDITRRKQAQEQLVLAIGEATEAKQMQEQFLANMSHEIRTPMNGIKGMTDLLLGTPLSEKQHELAGIIKSSVNNLLVIINDILDFSKIKAGKLNIEKIDFSVKDVLGHSVAIFEHRLKKKGLLLRIELDPAIPEKICGDPHRLNQVLINILGNAIKFTDKGSIQIRVDLQQRNAEDVVLAFTVSDTGIGIPPDSLPYIFDSFSQAGRDVSRLYGGTGLGLTICKQLLQLQGGEISARSAMGKGSEFSWHIPYGYSQQGENQQPVAETIFDYSNLLSGKHFLVAEDNEINQKLIDYVLRKAGGTVELANNGAEAIRHLQQDKFFDLIIMDLQMPEMDGYTATRYIRNDLHIHTPIIAMTATAMKGEQIQCIESGMNEYMTKPFEFGDLYKRISSLLSQAS